MKKITKRDLQFEILRNNSDANLFLILEIILTGFGIQFYYNQYYITSVLSLCLGLICFGGFYYKHSKYQQCQKQKQVK